MPVYDMVSGQDAWNEWRAALADEQRQTEAVANAIKAKVGKEVLLAAYEVMFAAHRRSMRAYEDLQKFRLD